MNMDGCGVASSDNRTETARLTAEPGKPMLLRLENHDFCAKAVAALVVGGTIGIIRTNRILQVGMKYSFRRNMGLSVKLSC